MAKIKGWLIECDECGVKKFFVTTTKAIAAGWQTLRGDKRVLCEKCAPEVIVPDYVIHGTYNAYANYGCRCAPCREAASLYMRGRTR